MHLLPTMNKAYTFPEIFTATTDMDTAISLFFTTHPEIIGDKEYITYKIKNSILSAREELNKNTNIVNIIGKGIDISHDVIPSQNNGINKYIYKINVFCSR